MAAMTRGIAYGRPCKLRTARRDHARFRAPGRRHGFSTTLSRALFRPLHVLLDDERVEHFDGTLSDRVSAAFGFAVALRGSCTRGSTCVPP